MYAFLWPTVTFSKHLPELWIFKQSLKMSPKYALNQGEYITGVLFQHRHVLQRTSAFFILILFAFDFNAQSQVERQTKNFARHHYYHPDRFTRKIDTKMASAPILLPTKRLHNSDMTTTVNILAYLLHLISYKNMVSITGRSLSLCFISIVKLWLSFLQ